MLNSKNRYLLVLAAFAAQIAILIPVWAEDDDRGILAKSLFSQEFADDTGIDVRGFFSGGTNWNPSTHDGGYNGPVSFNDRADRFQVDQVYFIAERKVDTEDWSLGGRVDFMYGTDYVFTTSRGFDDELSTSGNPENYGAAIPQAYLELNAPIGDGLTIKAGHFYTLLGYEVVPGKDNFFYSHAYSMQYGEPFTHWGALATYKFCNDLTITAGAVRGWDNLSDSADGNLSFLGGATYTVSDATTAVLSVISGNEGTGRNQTAYSAVVTHALSDSLSYVFQHDLGVVEEGMGSPAAQWYSVNNYLIQKIDDDISVGARLEWFRDDDGVRVVGVRSGAGGVPANYYQLTLGANIKVTDYLMVRPEVRYDYQELIKGATTKAFDNGTESSQFLTAANLIASF
jgi:hypothetical protein